MSDFLEECQVRFVDAQKRVQVTQAELQAAQARYQTAVQEQNSLQFMIHTEAARRQQQGNPPTSLPANAAKPEAIAAQEASTPQPTDVNKTDMIREFLRRHPAGVTPTEIWREVKNQMTHRAYLYSILGRLKDRDELIVRRKKYFLKAVPKTVEEKEQAVVLH